MCPARLIGEGGSLPSDWALTVPCKLPSFFCARSHLGRSFWASVSSHTEEVVVFKAIHVTGLFVCSFVCFPFSLLVVCCLGLLLLLSSSPKQAQLVDWPHPLPLTGEVKESKSLPVSF